MGGIVQYFLPYLELVFKIFLCSILTGAVGYNREKHDRVVGIRTHVLVGLSALTLQVISLEYIAINSYQGDIFRLGGQMISGIGFLGAGAIIKENKHIRGLTTASSIFFVACLGLVVGLGMYIPAICITLVAYAFLIDIFGFKKIIVNRKSKFVTIGIELNRPYQKCSKDIIDTLEEHGIEIDFIEVTAITMEKTKVILRLSVVEDMGVNDILVSLIHIESIVKTEVISKD